MKELNCKLLHSSPLFLAANGCRMSHDSHDKSDSSTMSYECTNCGFMDHRDDYPCGECGEHNFKPVDTICGPKDRDLIDRIGNKMKHESILEFVNYTWDIELTNKDLLALSKHRIGVSMVMRSTRYTTKKLLKDEKPFIFCQGSKRTDEVISDEAWDRSMKYIVHTGNDEIDTFNIRALENVRLAVESSYSNDEISMMLPASWIYRGQVQMNARSFKHFLELRAPGTHAHIGMQDLATRMLNSLPEEYKYLFKDIVNGK